MIITNASCPVCFKTNESEAWNKATSKKYDIEWMVTINDPLRDDANFVCPNCGKESVGHLLSIETTISA